MSEHGGSDQRPDNGQGQQYQPEQSGMYELEFPAPQLSAADGRGPVMVHAFEGFSDAGHAIKLAAQHLKDTLDTELVASFAIDELLDYRSRRPLMTFTTDHFTKYDDPELNLYALHDTAGTPFLLLDLDHFKLINDRYGHAIGDNVLREFSTLLRQLCPLDGVVARLGGEEFAIWLPGMTGDKARALAEQIRCATEELVSGDGVRFTVSLALGISQSGEGVDALLQRTDLALYQAKHLGRNPVELA